MFVKRLSEPPHKHLFSKRDNRFCHSDYILTFEKVYRRSNAAVEAQRGNVELLRWKDTSDKPTNETSYQSQFNRKNGAQCVQRLREFLKYDKPRFSTTYEDSYNYRISDEPLSTIYIRPKSSFASPSVADCLNWTQSDTPPRIEISTESAE
ncbi:unnamed protein product [Dicrocoelium dendriticum]|nr:unnamed protein product [Dicrocoelium dendriticum]